QIIKANFEAGVDFIIQGTLNADGTPEKPIVFTSIRDDSVGGDTGGDGALPIGRHDWNGIEFTSTSTANVLDHVEVRYGMGSGADQQGMIEVNGAPLALTNSILYWTVHDAL